MTTLVLAGSFVQFRYWQRQGVVPPDAKYVRDVCDLRVYGPSDAQLIEVGTPWVRRDYYELVSMARARGYCS